MDTLAELLDIELLLAELMGGLGVVVPVQAASSNATQGSMNNSRLQANVFIIIISLSNLKMSKREPPSAMTRGIVFKVQSKL